VSYLSSALQRSCERRDITQSELSRRCGVSRSFISRLCSGEVRDLSDENFVAILNVFSGDTAAQAELVAARCMDVRVGPGSQLVKIEFAAPKRGESASAEPKEAEVQLSHETEEMFRWLRRQCPLSPAMEKHLLGFAKMMGMPDSSAR
jgi:transcriptional regulator with XRE-family HTH domain